MNVINKISLISLVAVIVVGCYDNRYDYDPDIKMTFSPVMQANVKAVTDESVIFPTDIAFGVNALAVSSENEAVENFLCGAEVAYDGEKWTLGEDLFWPERSKKLSFIGWAPFDAPVKVDFDKGVQYQNVNVLGSITDCLYTDYIKGLDKVECGGEVNLKFHSAFAEIEFKVKNRVATQIGERIEVLRVDFNDFISSGDFQSLPHPQWNLKGEETSMTVFSGNLETSHNPVSIAEPIMMIPQKLNSPVVVDMIYYHPAGGQLNMTLTSEQNISRTLEPGRKYIITLTIGIDTVDDLCYILDIEEENLEEYGHRYEE